MIERYIYVILMEALAVLNVCLSIWYSAYIRKLAEFKKARKFHRTTGIIGLRWDIPVIKSPYLDIKYERNIFKDNNVFAYLMLDNGFEPYDEEQLKAIVKAGRRASYGSLVILWGCYALIGWLMPIPMKVVMNMHIYITHTALFACIALILCTWVISYCAPHKKNWWSSRQTYDRPGKFREAMLKSDEPIAMC